MWKVISQFSTKYFGVEILHLISSYWSFFTIHPSHIPAETILVLRRWKSEVHYILKSKLCTIANVAKIIHVNPNGISLKLETEKK